MDSKLRSVVSHVCHQDLFSFSRSDPVQPHACLQDLLTDSELRPVDSHNCHQNLPASQGRILSSLMLIFRILQTCLFSMGKVYVVFIYLSIRNDFLLKSSSILLSGILLCWNKPPSLRILRRMRQIPNLHPSLLSLPVLITFHSLFFNHFLYTHICYPT